MKFSFLLRHPDQEHLRRAWKYVRVSWKQKSKAERLNLGLWLGIELGLVVFVMWGIMGG